MFNWTEVVSRNNAILYRQYQLTRYDLPYAVIIQYTAVSSDRSASDKLLCSTDLAI